MAEIKPSSASAFRASLRREIAFLRASPWDLATLLWLPLAAALLVTWIFAAGSPRELPIVVVDHDHSALSQRYLRFVDAAPALRLAVRANSENEALDALRARTAYGALIVPEGFAREILSGQQASVQYLSNAQFATHAGAITRELQEATLTFAAGIKLAARSKRGESSIAVAETVEPIRVKLVSVFNPTIDYSRFLAAALIPAMLQIFAMIAGVAAVGRELRDHRVGEWLSEPRRATAALLGKLLPAVTLLTLIGWASVLGYAAWRAPMPLANTLCLLAAWALTTAACVGTGALIVALSGNYRMALSSAAFISAPAFAYAGQSFPLFAMPPVAQAWASVIPLTWWLKLQNALWLAQLPPAALLAPWLALAAFVIVALLVAPWRLAHFERNPHLWGKR